MRFSICQKHITIHSLVASPYSKDWYWNWVGVRVVVDSVKGLVYNSPVDVASHVVASVSVSEPRPRGNCVLGLGPRAWFGLWLWFSPGPGDGEEEGGEEEEE